jgi:hypothetical protein
VHSDGTAAEGRYPVRGIKEPRGVLPIGGPEGAARSVRQENALFEVQKNFNKAKGGNSQYSIKDRVF